MAYTKAKAKANKKWNDTNMDRVGVNVPKGDKEIYKAAAAAEGLSLNAWIRQAIEAKLANQVTE